MWEPFWIVLALAPGLCMSAPPACTRNASTSAHTKYLASDAPRMRHTRWSGR
jgi:hypothetical protein